MMKKIYLLWTALVLFLQTQAQDFIITIEPHNWTPAIGVQSFAWATHRGNYLIIGGRTDGLHRRQPFASFNTAGKNINLTVIDPNQKKLWISSVNSLPSPLAEQLSATNLEFYQSDSILLVAGGYGYSNTAQNHITYPYLTLVDVPQLINAIQNGKDCSPHFRQLKDSTMAVTGGVLKKVGDMFYLIGGQKFTGRYNPHGPEHGPGFKQEYTNAITRFTLQVSEKEIKINHAPIIKDSVNLHRRDFNVVPQIMPDGSQGLTAFSGVFQYEADLPYLSAVNINRERFEPIQAFKQYYNHYHCATLPLYNAEKNQMHTIFFGGIAQYYDSAGTLIKDDNIPFVKTIGKVTRHSDGRMEETKLTAEMPALLGAGSEFILHQNISTYANGVVNLNKLPRGKTEVGLIIGGILSDSPNIFWGMGGSSKATTVMYRVIVDKL